MTTLTPAQTKILRLLVASFHTVPMIRFASEKPIQRLLALGYITFEPTAYGAGTVRLTPRAA